MLRTVEPVLRIRDLKKTYMQGKIPVPALDGVSFDVNKGRTVEHSRTFR